MENSSLSLCEADGQGCPGTDPNHRSPSSWPSLLSCGPSSLSSLVHFSVLHSYRICLYSCVSLSFCLSFHLPVSVSLTLSLSSCHCQPYSVSCSQTVSDSMSVLCLWLSLPPSSWLLTKASAPTLHAWINLPISLSPWGEEQEEQAKGRRPSSMKEGDFKPERPGQAEAKNFSLTRRAGYLV